MDKKAYIKALENKGYKKLNDDQMTAGDLIFDIRQRGDSWCLKLNKESNLNLIPPAWS